MPISWPKPILFLFAYEQISGNYSGTRLRVCLQYLRRVFRGIIEWGKRTFPMTMTDMRKKSARYWSFAADFYSEPSFICRFFHKSHIKVCYSSGFIGWNIAWFQSFLRTDTDKQTNEQTNRQFTAKRTNLSHIYKNKKQKKTGKSFSSFNKSKKVSRRISLGIQRFSPLITTWKHEWRKRSL